MDRRSRPVARLPATPSVETRRAAGVATTAVRYHGVIHDFVMLNALKDTNCAKAATAQAAAFLAKLLDIQSV